MTTDPERWRPIEGWDGYEVSDQGRVRSWRPRGPNVPPPRVPRPRKLKNVGGTSCVVLAIDCERVTMTVGRAVLTAFVRPGGEHEIPRHLNADVFDCRLVNLEWSTLGVLMPERWERWRQRRKLKA